VLISHSTYTALGENVSQFGFEPLGFYQVKGKKEPLQVYRMVPPKPPLKWEGTL